MQKVLRLKATYRELILSDAALQGKVAAATNKSFITIYRWCKSNAPELTMLSVINTIKEHQQLSKTAELTEMVNVQKKAAA